MHASNEGIGRSYLVAGSLKLCDSERMQPAAEERPASEDLGSLMMFDEQRVLLRATWKPRRRFFNISLWRDDRVVETFHLSPEEAVKLTTYVNRAFVSSLPATSSVSLHAVRPAEQRKSQGHLLARLRRQCADAFEAAARRLRS